MINTNFSLEANSVHRLDSFVSGLLFFKSRCRNDSISLLRTNASSLKLYRFNAWNLFVSGLLFSKAVAVTIKYHCWEQRFFFEASIDSMHGIPLFPVIFLAEECCRNTIRHRWEKNPLLFRSFRFIIAWESICFQSFLTPKNVAVTPKFCAGKISVTSLAEAK